MSETAFDPSEKITTLCGELGLPTGVADKILDCLKNFGLFERLARIDAREKEMMKLLGTKTPDKIIHDLRNVLNELQLLKAVANLDDEEN